MCWTRHHFLSIPLFKMLVKMPKWHSTYPYHPKIHRLPKLCWNGETNKCTHKWTTHNAYWKLDMNNNSENKPPNLDHSTVSGLAQRSVCVYERERSGQAHTLCPEDPAMKLNPFNLSSPAERCGVERAISASVCVCTHFPFYYW